MPTRLLSVLSTVFVAMWLLWQGAALVVFANGVNIAHSSTDLVEKVGTVARTGSIPLVPRDRIAVRDIGNVRVVPDPDEPVAVGEPRTVLLDVERPQVARYKHADLTRPGDRYYVAGALALAVGAGAATVGARELVKVLGQRSPDLDQGRIRFLSHHRHGG